MKMTNTSPAQRGKEWAMAKTLLLIYSGIDYYIQSQEDKLNVRILQSLGSPELNTKDILDNIIDISVKLNILKTLKKEINMIINNMSKQDAEVIKKYFEQSDGKKTAKDLAKEAYISERSFYRRLDAAIANFTLILPEIGINSFTWANLMLNFGYFKEIFVKMLAI
jgi:hypothetical protein